MGGEKKEVKKEDRTTNRLLSTIEMQKDAIWATIIYCIFVSWL